MFRSEGPPDLLSNVAWGAGPVQPASWGSCRCCGLALVILEVCPPVCSWFSNLVEAANFVGIPVRQGHSTIRWGAP